MCTYYPLSSKNKIKTFFKGQHIRTFISPFKGVLLKTETFGIPTDGPNIGKSKNKSNATFRRVKTKRIVCILILTKRIDRLGRKVVFSIFPFFYVKKFCRIRICSENSRLHFVDNKVVRLGRDVRAPALLCTSLWSIL